LTRVAAVDLQLIAEAAAKSRVLEQAQELHVTRADGVAFEESIRDFVLLF